MRDIYIGRAFVTFSMFYIPTVLTENNLGARTWKTLKTEDNSVSLIHTRRDLIRMAKEITARRFVWKSRYACFKPDEFIEWIVSGTKNAHTIEEYSRAGVDCQLISYFKNGEYCARPIMDTASFLSEYRKDIRDDRMIRKSDFYFDSFKIEKKKEIRYDLRISAVPRRSGEMLSFV